MPIAAAALDVRGHAAFDPRAEIVLLPVDGGEPLALFGDGARVWRSLIGAVPTADEDLPGDDLGIVRELASAGLAVFAVGHPDAVRSLEAPRFPSPLHELVHVVVARVAERRGIRCVFVKGPELHHQGLRERAHSGDVDVWCEPRRWVELVAALGPLGWSREPDPWWGTPVGHSATLTPPDWGCQIDVHRRMPGMTLDDDEAFARVLDTCESVSVAGRSIRVPARDAHGVIAALHAARPEVGRGASPSGLDLASDLLRRLDDPVAACDRLGAIPALREALLRAVPDAELPSDRGVPRDWAWRDRPDRARAYFAALGEYGLRARATLLWRLVWPSAEVAIESARRAGYAGEGPLRARLHRVLRGVRGLLTGRVARR